MPLDLTPSLSADQADEFESTFGELSITTPEELSYILQHKVDWEGFNPNLKQREATADKKEGNPYASITIMVTDNPQITIGGEDYTGNRLQFQCTMHNVRPVGAAVAERAAKPAGKAVAALSFGDLKKRYSK